MGIDELKKLIHAVLSIGEVGGLAYEDGKIDTADLPLVTQLWTVIMDVWAINFAAVVPQFTDIDAAEANELVEYVKADFDIPQDKIEETIERALEIAARQYLVVVDSIALVKSLRA